jgi:hypothetical protein
LTRELPGHSDTVKGARLVDPSVALILIAVAYTAAGIVFVRNTDLSFDETVYLSQVNPRVPTLYLSAPRTRGASIVAAPLVWMTSSVVALRIYLAMVSGAGLVLAFWPWLRVMADRWMVPVAALAFSGLWVVLFYGPRAMPNLYVAFAAVASVGWLLRYVNDHSRRALFGVAASLAVVALMRPGDAFWLASALFVAVVAIRAWRRLSLVVTMAAGLAVGIAPWVIEAFTRYGGLAARLRRSSEIEGGMGWHPEGLLMELQAVNGPTLCRPCTVGIGNPIMSLWWLAIPVLVVGGLIAARRVGQLAPLALATGCGMALALQYSLLLGYAAPRFLTPAYALLSLPIAGLLVIAARTAPARRRRAVGIVIATGFSLHLASQLVVLGRYSHQVDPHRYPVVAARLHALGIRPPCTLSGRDAFPVAYYAGCRGEQTSGHNQSISVTDFLGLANREPTAILTRGGRVPAYARNWRPYRITAGDKGWVAYLPPDGLRASS